MKATFLDHLLHRRCDRCYMRGFYDAAMLQERKEGLIRDHGMTEQEAEALLRIRLASR